MFVKKESIGPYLDLLFLHWKCYHFYFLLICTLKVNEKKFSLCATFSKCLCVKVQITTMIINLMLDLTNGDLNSSHPTKVMTCRLCHSSDEVTSVLC